MEFRNDRGLITRVELEYDLSAFNHNVDECEMIITWENDQNTIRIKNKVCSISIQDSNSLIKKLKVNYNGTYITKDLILLHDLCSTSSELYRLISA